MKNTTTMDTLKPCTIWLINKPSEHLMTSRQDKKSESFYFGNKPWILSFTDRLLQCEINFLKTVTGVFKVGLYEALLHSQCVIYSRCQLACSLVDAAGWSLKRKLMYLLLWAGSAMTIYVSLYWEYSHCFTFRQLDLTVKMFTSSSHLCDLTGVNTELLVNCCLHHWVCLCYCATLVL